MENMVGLSNFFRNRKILVTGHTGFKGSWLTLILSKIGAITTGISLDPKNPNDAYVSMDINAICNDIRHDITEYEGLVSILKKIEPEIVFHLAAQALVIDSYKDPLHTFSTNIMGTANILEACRNTPSVKAAVIVTSDKCYQNSDCMQAFTETDTLGGNDPYSSSKAACEIITNAFRRSFFKSSVAIATVRAGNVIGGGDWSKNRIIPDCIRALKNGHEIILRNPDSIRPWQHVIEPLRGYLVLAKNMVTNPEDYAEAWNFGPELSCSRTVRHLASEVIYNWGNGKIRESKGMVLGHEANVLSLDISKAKYKLGWMPALTFEESVKLTVDWYKAQSEDIDMQCFSLKQISEYFNKLEIN